MSARNRSSGTAMATGTGQMSLFPPSEDPSDYPVPEPISGHRLPRVWMKILKRAQQRHRWRGQSSAPLDAAGLTTMYHAQGGRCAVSGLAFSMVVFGGGAAPRPYGPSLDQITPDGGYSPENVQIVLWAVNCGMGRWGREHFMLIARAAVEREKRLMRNTLSSSRHSPVRKSLPKPAARS
jgi:hypothetical protein